MTDTMTTLQRIRFDSLRDPVAILRTFENKYCPIDAGEYIGLASRAMNGLRNMADVELVVIARSMVPVLAQFAESVLIERSADHLIDDAAQRLNARMIGEQVLRTLRLPH
jgi:hypothetical protein